MSQEAQLPHLPQVFSAILHPLLIFIFKTNNKSSIIFIFLKKKSLYGQYLPIEAF